MELGDLNRGRWLSVLNLRLKYFLSVATVEDVPAAAAGTPASEVAGGDGG